MTVYAAKMRSQMITLMFFCILAINSIDFVNTLETALDRTARSLSDSDDLVPLINIRGTKLYTGMYYRVSMKVFPQGWITWTNRGNYIEVELNPSELPYYSPGQTYQYDNQWSFGATESDLGYTLTNRGKPFGFLLWVNAGAGSGNHVSIYDDSESLSKMSADGEWRKDALWIPQSTNEENYYKLENLAKRGSFLTWTYKKHNEFNYYIQLASYDAKEDSKFLFKPSGIKLEAKIYDLEFAETLDDIFKKDQRLTKVFVAKKHFPNFSDSEITYTVEESTQTTDFITIEFKDSLAMMYRATVSTKLLANDDIELSFNDGFEANQAKLTNVTKTLLSEKMEIQIPAYTDIETTIYTVMANDIEMLFTAKMHVVGSAERMVINHPDEIREGNVPADVVEDFIKSSGGSKMKTISSSGDNLILRVSGVIKGNIGLKTILSTDEVTIWTQPSTQSPFIWD